MLCILRYTMIMGNVYVHYCSTVKPILVVKMSYKLNREEFKHDISFSSLFYLFQSKSCLHYCYINAVAKFCPRDVSLCWLCVLL